MPELTIAKLAIPRKANVRTKTASFVDTETAYTIEQVSVSQTSVIPDISGWSVTVYTGNSTSNVTTGMVSYAVVDDGYVDSYAIKKIQCTKPDGSTFLIDPGYGLVQGNYVVDIRFHSWWYRPSSGGTHQPISGAISYPYRRELRTADGVNFGVALPTDYLAFKVEYLVYYQPNQTLDSDWRMSAVLDSQSTTQAGYGGLTAYRVKAGSWDTDRITPKMQDLNMTFR